MNAVIKSPGVPQDAPVVVAARAVGKAVIGELELGWRMIPNRFVAVTGTNGKTTVTEWLGHVFAEAGMPFAVAGNVGTPLASLDDVDPEATVVCECSSFQLEDSVAFAPEVAVLLNFSPDHLDRHGTLDAYLDAKLRIFAFQPAGADAIYDADEPALWEVEMPGEARRLRYGIAGCADGGCMLRLDGDELRDDEGVLIERSGLALAGEHNLRNAMAVAAAAISAAYRALRSGVGSGTSRAFRTGSSGLPRSTASDTSTTPRPRTSRRPGPRSRRSGMAFTRSSAAASRASGSAISSRRSPATARPAT